MTEAQAHEALLKRWEAGWHELHVPATGSEVKWTPTNELFDALPEWVRVAIVPVGSRQSALGKFKRWTRTGFVAVQIFTRSSIGTFRASELADDVRTVLEGQFLSTPADPSGDPVVTYAGSSGSSQSDGVWFMLTVTVPYSFDQLRGAPIEEPPVPSALNTQNFRYTVLAEQAEYIIALPEERATTNYRVGWDIADGVFTVDGQVPIASRTTTQFRLVPDAPLSIGDVLEFTVEDLT